MDYNLKGDLHLGEVFYLDVSSRKVIAKGHGYIDLAALNLTTKLTTVIPGTFNQLLVVIKTSAGYMAPYALYSETLFPESRNTASYNMRAYLQWPTACGVAHPLEQAPSISISIHAKHAQDSTQSTIHADGISERLIRSALAGDLDSFTYRNCLVSISSGYTTSRYTEKVRGKTNFKLSTFIRYRFTCRDKPLLFRDVGKILLAFELYWICYFDLVDCNIESIRMGEDIYLHMADSSLYATSVSSHGYQSILRIDSDLHAKTLAKMAHFFLNPNHNKRLGASSKVGLAFSRIIDYRFRTNSEMASMNIASLIFAIQSLSEGIAEGEIQKANYANKDQTMAGIRRVTQAIALLEDVLPEEVSQFYRRSETEIYSLMSRPTFMRSLELSLKKLDIDINQYRLVLKSISVARRQIVHSEGYSAEFILGLLTHTITQMEIGAKGEQLHSIVHEESDIDRLYNLLRLMSRNYFKKQRM